MPHRLATDKQLAALVIARAALVKKHTCERCGCEDPARGLQRQSQDRIYNTTRDGVTHRYCISCRIYFRWTGKLESHNGQIVEIAIFDQGGQAVYHSLCKPDVPMPPLASEINGLTDEVLAEAPSFAQIWPDLMQVLISNEIPIYVWNADFDRPMLLKTAQRFGLSVPETISNKKRWRCAMKLHARWYGEWSNSKNDYRWQRLATACWDLEVAQDAVSHRAVGDAQGTLQVLRAIAQRNGASPAPQEMPYNQHYYGD